MHGCVKCGDYDCEHELQSTRRFNLDRRPTTWKEKIWFLFTERKWRTTVGFFVEVMPGEAAYETAEFMETIIYHSDILRILTR